MIFSYLKEDNLSKLYSESKKYTESLTQPFKEFERIARNLPKQNIPKKYPKTTDGTTASIIKQRAKRTVQQIPTGRVISDDQNDWLPIVADFILNHKIIPYANEDYDLIQKSLNLVERADTFGAAASYTPFLNHDGYFSPDLSLLYWGDVFIQPGKKSAAASKYLFVRTWVQPEDIDALIDQEKQLAKSAKQRGEKYESTYDLKALESVRDDVSNKDDKAQTPHEQELAVTSSGVEFITGFQIGVGATYFTFVPNSSDDKEVTIIRRKVSKDPRGKYPIQWIFGDIDGSNPLGRSICAFVGGLQNLIDSDMQMYQFNRALSLDPPIIKRGNFSKNKIITAPGVVIDLGVEQGASIDAMSVDTTGIAQYPNLYGLQKSQLLNLVSSPDTSVSAEVGNPGFSKTDSGVKALQNRISVDDNSRTKNFEAWFEEWAECAVNLFFAERTGTEELQLDNKTAARLRKLADEGYFDESKLSEDNKILINYDTDTPALKFRVDASTSTKKSESEQLDANLALLERLEQSQLLQQIIPADKIAATWNAIVSASGVEDPENLSVDLEEFKKQQEEAQAQAQAQMQAQAAAQELPQEQAMDAGPELAQENQEQQPSVDDLLTQELRAMGAPDSLIADALDAADKGMSADQILESIHQLMTQGAGNARG